MTNETNPYRYREVSAQDILQATISDCRERENLITKELNAGCR